MIGPLRGTARRVTASRPPGRPRPSSCGNSISVFTFDPSASITFSALFGPLKWTNATRLPSFDQQAYEFWAPSLVSCLLFFPSGSQTNSSSPPAAGWA